MQSFWNVAADYTCCSLTDAVEPFAVAAVENEYFVAFQACLPCPRGMYLPPPPRALTVLAAGIEVPTAADRQASWQ